MRQQLIVIALFCSLGAWACGGDDPSESGEGDADADSDTDGDTDSDADADSDDGDPCTHTCTLQLQCEQGWGGTVVDGDCENASEICCTLDNAPSCETPAECIEGNSLECLNQGGTAVAAVCDNPEQNSCCDFTIDTDDAPCTDPAECIEGTVMDCIGGGGLPTQGACDQGEVCCVVDPEPCESPHECLSMQECLNQGALVPYACETQGQFCCDLS